MISLPLHKHATHLCMIQELGQSLRATVVTQFDFESVTLCWLKRNLVCKFVSKASGRTTARRQCHAIVKIHKHKRRDGSEIKYLDTTQLINSKACYEGNVCSPSSSRLRPNVYEKWAEIFQIALYKPAGVPVQIAARVALVFQNAKYFTITLTIHVFSLTNRDASVSQNYFVQKHLSAETTPDENLFRGSASLKLNFCFLP